METGITKFVWRGEDINYLLERLKSVPEQNTTIKNRILCQILEDLTSQQIKTQAYVNSMLYWRGRAQELEKVINEFCDNAKEILER